MHGSHARLVPQLASSSLHALLCEDWLFELAAWSLGSSQSTTLLVLQAARFDEFRERASWSRGGGIHSCHIGIYPLATTLAV